MHKDHKENELEQNFNDKNKISSFLSQFFNCLVVELRYFSTK